jgi:hypothetical protein
LVVESFIDKFSHMIKLNSKELKSSLISKILVETLPHHGHFVAELNGKVLEC